MAILAFLPLAIIGFVVILVAAVFGAIEIRERRRSRLYAQPRRRHGFRPVMINGGKPEEPAAMPEEIDPVQTKARLLGGRR